MSNRETGTMISSVKLAEVFVEVADTLVADYDLIDFLHTLADHAAELTSASTVGLVLMDHNEELQYMAASEEGAKHLELFQLQYSEGPCLDCHQTGKQVLVPDLRDATERWPNFAPQALAAGVHSVHAFPMRLRDVVIGALNIFGDRPLPLGADDVRVIQALADIATISIIQERAVAHAEMITEQLQGAFNSRIVIEQAKGVISRAHGIGVDAAFEQLRSHARRNHLRLSALAHDVVAGAAAIPGLD